MLQLIIHPPVEKPTLRKGGKHKRGTGTDPIPTPDPTFSTPGTCVETWTLVSSVVVVNTVETTEVFDSFFGINAQLITTILSSTFKYAVNKECSYIDPITGEKMKEIYPTETKEKGPYDVVQSTRWKNPVLDFIGNQGVSVIVGSGGVSIGTGTINYGPDNQNDTQIGSTSSVEYGKMFEIPNPTADNVDTTITGFVNEDTGSQIGWDPGLPTTQSESVLIKSAMITISTPVSSYLKTVLLQANPSTRFNDWAQWTGTMSVGDMRRFADSINSASPQTRDQIYAMLTGYEPSVLLTSVLIEYKSSVDVTVERW